MQNNSGSVSIPEGFFLDIPKVDIHCHWHGTLRESTLKEFVRESGGVMSDEAISGLYFRGEKPVGVLATLRFMEEHVFNSQERLARITKECLEDLAAGNVRYTELFFSSTGVLQHNPSLNFEDLQSAVTGAMEEAEKTLGISARLIHAIDRQASPEAAVELVEAVLKHPDPRVVGIGMDYLETDHPPEGFWKAYRMAHEAGLKTTIHAGEFGCHWRNVETAIDLLEVDRLDHGYTILDNDELVQHCIDLDKIVTVVPTNSYYLRTLNPSNWAERHPIRQMGRRGLKIHPNTDDPTFHNVTPEGVWKMMHEDFGYNVEELRGFMLNGLQAIWVDEVERQRMTAEFQADFDLAVAKHNLVAA